MLSWEKKEVFAGWTGFVSVNISVSLDLSCTSSRASLARCRPYVDDFTARLSILLTQRMSQDNSTGFTEIKRSTSTKEFPKVVQDAIRDNLPLYEWLKERKLKF